MAETGHGPRPGAGDKGSLLHGGTEGMFWQWGIFSRGICCTAAWASVAGIQPHLCSFPPPPSIIYGQDGLLGLTYM